MALQSVLQMMLVLLFLQEAFAEERSTAKPGCQQRCGNLVIAYPFGIGVNCSADQRLEISCNNSFDPPKAFLNDNKLEVLSISVENGTIQVNNPVIIDCANGSNGREVILSDPFTFSSTQNRFTAIGCNNLALMSRQGLNIGGCMSICNITLRDNNCFGINCCQTRIPPSLKFTNASFKIIDPKIDQRGCRYASIVDQNWFGSRKDIYSVQTMEQVPAVLDWRLTGSCQSFCVANPSMNRSICGLNTLCTNQSLCSCSKGYEGNPYLLDGCQDINECKLAEEVSQPKCGDHQICTNTPGGYNCSCSDGWVLNEKNDQCMKVDSVNKAPSVIAIAIYTLLGVLLVPTAIWLYKIMKGRNMSKLKKKFFKRNGGLLLQQASSREGNVETTKLFTLKELAKATNHYSVDRILGQGGQGTVYKGMLTDGKIVAVKKSRIEDESKLEQFINEVVILSQINHRNVVKLHGCCLETEVPLLVYEFIPNGTLYEYIHDHNEDFQLNWDARVRVATEVAGALSYLHSAACIPVYHRDIKSSNILLDEKYRAKVADFGTSRSISIDQSHLTTEVQGTFGYLDPEYFQSSKFTEKSDVYSFGVVLVELLTGQKPILAPRPDDEGQSLVTHFIMTMEQDRIIDIIDLRIMEESVKEEIIEVASIAYRCLNMIGRNRPTMKQVAAELESIKTSHGSATSQQDNEDAEYSLTELDKAWDLTSISVSSSATMN